MSTQIKMWFDSEVAKDIGTDAAIILSNIKFWEQTNRANNVNYHDGRYWTYNSIEAFCILFDYLTKSKIRTCLKNLEEKGYIESGNYNKSSYDRTKWYTTTPKIPFENSDTTICQISQMDLSNSANRFVRIDEPIPDNKHRYINTDINTTTSNSENEFSEEDSKKYVNENLSSSQGLATEKKELQKIAPKSFLENFSEEVIEVARECLKCFPAHLHPNTKKAKERTLDTIDKLIRIDQIPPDEVIRLVKCAREDSFWSQNFLSLNKLRSKNKEGIRYIVVFHEKFKAKEQKINRQTQETIINNSKGW